MPRFNIRRSIVLEFEIAAPVEAVWKALTEPDELARWLPLQARVNPGKGGFMWLSWGDPVIQESTIEVWEPNKHLRLKEVRPFGEPFQPQEEAAVQREIDYTLQSEGGKTLLRLEHSGFGTGPNSDAFYNALMSCWQFQMSSLGVYVEQHLGQNRTVSWARSVSPMSFPETWKRVMGPQGFLSERKLETSNNGDRYAFRTATGDVLNGVVLTYTPDKQFAGIVENMNNALLRIVLDHCGGKPEVTVWLASYEPVHEDANLFEQRWTNHLQNILY